ncbi:unnamed protein product [Candidula unifasciata]|uniref:SSD domain-containing protein n=1 Tax=Candidula unifasciata TaxID=100452 RepID=A0A8S3YKL1_9EUPU|nr:unnamed protein product [Candidula unifasciata]
MECVWNCQRAILNWFYRYGFFLAKHPFWFLIIPIVICVALAGGFAFLDHNEDIEYLYAPSTSRSIDEREVVKKTFPDLSDDNFSPFSLNTQIPQSQIIFRSKQEGSILTEEVMNELTPFYRTLITMSVMSDGQNISFADICKKQRDQCVIYGGFVFDEHFLDKVKAGSVTFPTWTEQPDADLAIIFARVNVSLSNKLLSAGSLRMTFPMRSANKDWESAFVSLIQETQFTTADIVYAKSGSMAEELDKGTKGDILFFSLTFTLMITYASIVSSGGDCVTSRMLLANAGVLAVGFGIIGSIGLVLFCKVQFVSIVGTMPFLTLGIGVDDMFLLMSSWSETLSMTDLTIPERMGTVYRKAGIGITITSVTDFLAFAIGASSRFRSVRNFCIFTGVAVLLCYICNACVFGACLTLHARRVYASRHSIVCRKVKSRKQLKAEGASCCRICMCGGEVPETAGADQSVCEWGPRKLLVRFLLWNPVRYFILLFFAAYLGVAIWGCTRLEQGLELKNLAPESSYFYKFQSWNDEDFGYKLPISFVTTKEKDYTKNETLQEIKQLLQTAQKDSLIVPNMSICWLTSLADTNFYNTTSTDAFFSGLNDFLQIVPIFKNDIVFEGNHTITASRCHVYSQKVSSSNDQANVLTRMRQLADDSPAGVFAFNPNFVIFEQYLVIIHDTLQTVGVTIAVMFVATCIFLPHPLMVILVIVQVFMIVVGIFGFMAHWGLTLSSITMIELIMSVGFSVDFCAHVCTAYMVSEEHSKEDRAKDAIIHASSPIFNGGLSSLIGVFMLIFSASYIFQAFFKIMLLVIGFGVLHAVFLVPVILSFIGPSAHVRLDKVSPRDLKDSKHQNGSAASPSSDTGSETDKADTNDINLPSSKFKDDNWSVHLHQNESNGIPEKEGRGNSGLISETESKNAKPVTNGGHVTLITVQSPKGHQYDNRGFTDDLTVQTAHL